MITKTYSNRLSTVIASKLEARQTAYLKGRIINDNIRSIISCINVANLEEELDGLIVSLDAKKAFDSVEHNYIIKCLIKFGLKDFVGIFKMLYNDLKSDIIINGKVIEGYKIL